ncbi:MAG: 3-deoxy-7-phosphoheptulonate synthase, partial [Acidobacteria bacterium]|nr:3-deoxy-7-phosphoheptulonate synthase [Acidobacteriota bacterium]
AEIDRIDRELIRALAERMEAVRRIAAHKRDNPDVPLRNDEREREVFQVWSEQGRQHGLSPYFIGRILREVLNYSRRDQERVLVREDEPERAARSVRVGYQGAPGAYSDLAIEKLFTSRPQPVKSREGFHTFAAALDALESGEVQYVLLPIENTIAGSINDVYRLLAERRVHVVDEEVWAVEHVLAGLPGATLEDLEIVRSHPVALQQCQVFLGQLVGVTAESHFDTAGSAFSVAEAGDRRIAAICSEEAARRAGLEVLRREVADREHNITRFVLVGLEAERVDARVRARTSLLFTADHRRGALAACLQYFADQGINLCKLESRPLPETPWEYLFYVDLEGNVEDPRLAAALQKLAEHTNHLRVLGCYPDRSVEGGLPEEAAELEVAPAPVAPPPAQPKQGAKEPLVTNVRPDATERAASVVRVGTARIGAPDEFTLILGPCAVENRAQVMEAAEMARDAGAKLLRGGAFKPRSSPYSFQGLGWEGLALLAEAGRAYDLPIVTEVLRPEDVERVAQTADVLQVGARNMQNFALLTELGRVRRPVLLKRGMSATIGELLAAAEYVLAGGNQQVVLCERGIRTFETATRATLDVSAVPVLKARTHLPVIVDPSHAAGVRELVIPLALAAVAAGADGLIVEVHPNPDEALCDKDQALTADQLRELVRGAEAVVRTQGRTF